MERHRPCGLGAKHELELAGAASRRYPSNTGTERLLYCDFLDPNADPRIYQEVEDINKLKLVVNDFLEEHNAESKSPMPLVRGRVESNA